MQEQDPLWYDRVEPEEKPSSVLTIMALFFVGTLKLYGLPSRLYRAVDDRLIRRVPRSNTSRN